MIIRNPQTFDSAFRLENLLARAKAEKASPVLDFWIMIPIVSIVVPFFGLTNSICRIPYKELQWRLLLWIVSYSGIVPPKTSK